MKTSEALRLTKAKVWRGNSWGSLENKSRFICFAARRCGPSVTQAVIPIIGRLLGDSFSLEVWLQRHHQIDARFDCKKAQATRLAWLDHLIAHYKSIGD